IAPEYARLLAINSTWQLFITEGCTLAQHWHAANSAQPCPADVRRAHDGDAIVPPPHRSPSGIPGALPALPAAASGPDAAVTAGLAATGDESTDTTVFYPDIEVGPPLDPDYEEFLLAAYEKQRRARQAERDETRRICHTSPPMKPGAAFGRARP